MRTLIVVSDKLGDGENGTLILHSESYSRGAALVLAERYRVMDVKGITTEEDTKYELDELVNASGAYLFGPGPTASEDGTPYCWPFSPEHWHGGQDRIADLVRAGQFITAEIDRLLELADKGRNPVHPEIPSVGGPMKKAGSRLAGFRSDGDRLEANADTLSPTARVFEPGTGSDPATWFDTRPIYRCPECGSEAFFMDGPDSTEKGEPLQCNNGHQFYGWPESEVCAVCKERKPNTDFAAKAGDMRVCQDCMSVAEPATPEQSGD